MIKEACVESFREALMAERKGADRIELCAELHVGGTTPSYAVIEKTAGKLKIPVMVMIRPRGGHFIYNRLEIKIMQQSILICRETGVKGIVLGVLDFNNRIDVNITALLTEFAHPLEVTFHKAIDETGNPVEELEKLLRIPGITRVLTSGKAPTALEGKIMIRKMIENSGNNLIIMPAGRITSENLDEVAREIPAREFHGRKIVGNLN